MWLIKTSSFFLKCIVGCIFNSVGLLLTSEIPVLERCITGCQYIFVYLVLFLNILFLHYCLESEFV
jgi:hypothetical protein